MTTELTLDKELDYRAKLKETITQLESAKTALQEIRPNVKVGEDELRSMVRLILPFAEEGLALEEVRAARSAKRFWILKQGNVASIDSIAISDDEELYVMTPIEGMFFFGILALLYAISFILSTFFSEDADYVKNLYYGFSLLTGLTLTVPCLILWLKSTKYKKWEEGAGGLSSLDIAALLAENTQEAQAKLDFKLTQAQKELERVNRHTLLPQAEEA